MTPPASGPAPAAAPTPLTALSQSMSSSGGRYQIRVRYYRRMKFQRVYALVAEATPADGKTSAAGAPLVVRPIIPGAMVSPLEHTVAAKSANSKATFYVTPLALGQLKNARLEVGHQGALLQEIPLPTKVVRQRATWFLALLTVLVPALLIYFTQYLDFSRGGPFRQDLPPSLKAVKKTQPDPMRGPIELGLQRNIPDKLSLQFTEVEIAEYKPPIALGAQDGYEFVQGMQGLPVYAFVALLFLTLVSWVMHRAVRGSRKGKPLLLPL